MNATLRPTRSHFRSLTENPTVSTKVKSSAVEAVQTRRPALKDVSNVSNGAINVMGQERAKKKTAKPVTKKARTLEDDVMDVVIEFTDKNGQPIEASRERRKKKGQAPIVEEIPEQDEMVVVEAENAPLTPEEPLIDDIDEPDVEDPQSVTEYVDEIYAYMRQIQVRPISLLGLYSLIYEYFISFTLIIVSTGP